jgi:D-methionine transport system substrate-binding protein
MNIRHLHLIAAIAIATSFTGAALAQDKPLKVGVTAGPHAQILEVVKKVAERDGLKLQVIEFNDYVQPNAALANGDLDINSYQHQPYLDATVKDRGYKLVSIAQTVTFPIGLYSKRYKSLDQIPEGGRVAIPNDPTNGGRALLLLADKGVIKLKPDAGLKATPLDVVDNPKKLKIIELDAAQLPRALDEVDAAAVNTNYALPAGLVPTRDAIALENPRSPYANVIAVRAQDKDNPAYKKFVKAYHSDEVKQFVAKEFKGSVIPAW